MTNLKTYVVQNSRQNSDRTGCFDLQGVTTESSCNTPNLEQLEILKLLTNLNQQMEEKLEKLNLNKNQIQKNSLILATWMGKKLENLISMSPGKIEIRKQTVSMDEKILNILKYHNKINNGGKNEIY